MASYERILHKNLYAELFVQNILEIDDVNKIIEVANQIVIEERNLRGADQSSTLSDLSIRNLRYRTEKDRDALCTQILDELIQNKRLVKDDDISLGKGGAAPNTSPRQERVLLYVIGPPASGKSGICNSLADAYGAYILDSDYVKRKLPEYDQLGGASLVHEESDAIVFSREKGNLLQYCISRGQNIVVPKIGHNQVNIVEFASKLKGFHYKVYLISVDLDRKKATQRAYYRYVETKRYIPLSLIFDGYGNDPILNYFRIKQRVKHTFSGFAQISTDVKKGDPPVLIEQNNMPLLSRIFTKKSDG